MALTSRLHYLPQKMRVAGKKLGPSSSLRKDLFPSTSYTLGAVFLFLYCRENKWARVTAKNTVDIKHPVELKKKQKGWCHLPKCFKTYGKHILSRDSNIHSSTETFLRRINIICKIYLGGRCIGGRGTQKASNISIILQISFRTWAFSKSLCLSKCLKYFLI